MEDHAEIGGVEGHLAEDLRGTGERHQSVEKPYCIKRERHAQPGQSHKVLIACQVGLLFPTPDWQL